MGCNSSKDAIMTRIKQQDAKIDALIRINQELEQKLGEFPTNTCSDGKHANETNDLTGLKTTIDQRFNKLEDVVQKIHHELKLKLFEGVMDNLEKDHNNGNGSLSLDFDKENKAKVIENKKGENAPWKDLLNDSNMASPRMTLDKAYNHEEPGLVDRLSNPNRRPTRNPETRNKLIEAAINRNV